MNSLLAADCGFTTCGGTMHRVCLLSSVVLAVALGGCQPSTPSAQSQPAGNQTEAEGRLFGVSFQTMNNPFFVELNEGLKEAIEAHGDRLVALDAQFNSLKQKNDLSDLVLQGAAGIFINPVNWEGIRGSLLQAKRKKIPCIVVDAPANLLARPAQLQRREGDLLLHRGAEELRVGMLEEKPHLLAEARPERRPLQPLLAQRLPQRGDRPRRGEI